MTGFHRQTEKQAAFLHRPENSTLVSKQLQVISGLRSFAVPSAPADIEKLGCLLTWLALCSEGTWLPYAGREGSAEPAPHQLLLQEVQHSTLRVIIFFNIYNNYKYYKYYIIYYIY